MKVHLTERKAANLSPPKAGNVIVYDDEVRGFGLRVTAAGVKSFILNYSIHNRERRYTVGRYPEMSVASARTEALAQRERIRQGHDPLQEKEAARGEPTMADLGRDYMEGYAIQHKRPKSINMDRLMLDGIVLPKLGKLRVSAVGQRDIEALHQSMKPTPHYANRVLALLSTMFNYAKRSDNPAKGITRFPEDKREEWLTAEQLRALETALDSYSNQLTADAVRLIILTGSRPGEVLGASWDMFDLERAVWTKPSHHTKQRKTEHIPLSAPALEILKRMAAAKTGPYLFPGAVPGKPRVTVVKPWRAISKAAGLVKGNGKPLFRPYSLRHTFASHLVSNGESLYLVGKLLGHTQPNTTMRYAHVADSALRDASNRFGDILKAANQS